MSFANLYRLSFYAMLFCATLVLSGLIARTVDIGNHPGLELYGLGGALLWAAGLLMAVGAAVFRRAPPELEPWRLGLIAYAACWLVVSNFTPLGYSFSNYLLWTWAGLLGVAAAPRRAGPQDG